MRRNALVLTAALWLCPRPASAGDNDLVLGRLGTVIDDGTTPRTVGQNLEFRSLVSELGVALAPRLSTPADTLGTMAALDAWRAHVAAGGSSFAMRQSRAA